MNRFFDIQEIVASQLQKHPGFPAGMKVIAREEKNIENDIAAAIAKLGVCLFVMPLLPKRAMKTESAILFFESVEVRIRVIENPILSKKINFTVYDAMEATMVALQGFNPDIPGLPEEKIFAAPLELASAPVELVEDPDTRVLDVIFDVPIQLQS